ncbi:hypothetical protein JW960_16405 [candidate division KSB1 bacterium]|nr:hypothetical protein [candidate division KSB1 bacterium]
MHRFTFALGILVCCLAVQLSAQEQILTLGLGLSKDMRTGDNMWNPGLQFKGSFFKKSTERLWYGLNVAYNKWNFDESTYEASSGYSIDSAEGSLTLIELAPSLRIPLGQGAVCLRVGAGLFFVSEADVEIRETGRSGWSTTTLTSEGGTGLAFQPGVEVSIGSISIVPLYSVYMLNSEVFNHIAVTAELKLNLK